MRVADKLIHGVIKPLIRLIRDVNLAAQSAAQYTQFTLRDIFYGFSTIHHEKFLVLQDRHGDRSCLRPGPTYVNWITEHLEYLAEGSARRDALNNLEDLIR